MSARELSAADPRRGAVGTETGGRSARRPAGERLHELFEGATAGGSHRVAVESADGPLTFGDLRRWSDELARRLERDVAPGDRVALLFDRTPRAWVAMLALSKLAAAWVPLDPSFPAERIAFIARDSGARLVLTTADLAGRLDGVGLAVRTVPDPVRGGPADAFPARDAVADLAYVIYTSGTSGTPKGVPIGHRALCNFVRVAADCYGYRPEDRVYQGLTIAFDFAVEEIWVPLVVGARLVPAPEGPPLVGAELGAFLADRRVTALCCVPTVLASIEADLPALRLLMVSGESCPAALVDRWAVDGRRMLNLYGPTETTVSATWSVLVPGAPVTIGTALPTYWTFVADPETGLPVPMGEPGELVIGGVGVARGYLNRPDLTARAFVPDPTGGADSLLYRTGDLVRLDGESRIVYLGRIDSQVKIRGYRIELDEIESVLLAVPGVVQAAVTVVDVPGVGRVLAGYYTDRVADPVAPALLQRALQQRLPGYMVPASLDRLAAIPMTPNQKVDRRALPAPTRAARPAPVHTAADPREAAIARCVALVLGLDDVDVTADLFRDLGADSFSVARCCAALRDGPLPGVTTRLVYAHTSVRALAAASGSGRAPEPASLRVHRATRRAYAATGAAQALVLLTAVLGGAAGIVGVDQLLSRVTGIGTYLAAVAVTALGALGLLALPVVLKWLLIGRWTEREIPAWGPAYLRFWIVRSALRSSPARLLVGSPLYTLFLRAMGVRVGPGALVLTDQIPVCADLVEIGADAVVGPGVKLDGYRVEHGVVRTGRVRLGRGAIVGYGSHLDIGVRIGDDGRLAHASALLQGQRVPDGRAWHGSPALDAGAAPDAEPAPRIGRGRRAAYAVLQVASLVLVTGPLAIGVVIAAVDLDVFDPLRAAWFAGALLAAAWLVRALVPRLLALLLRPGRDYPLYGRRWAGLRAAIRIANSPLLNELFGDSSAIVFYLRSVGVRFRRVLQTGSNFGTAQHFDVPSWCSIGGGTLISDGLAMPNAEFSPHSFRVSRIRVGDRVFMGNGVVYPPGAGVGDDVLLATKVMVPVDGALRSGVGLLGSPAFEVPRSVRRDEQVRADDDEQARRRGLAAKNRHNAATGALFLLHRFVVGYLAVAALTLADQSNVLELAAAILVAALGELLLLAATDAACRGFRRLRPLTCSLYDARFWRHERYWKLSDPKALAVLDGTPFKAVAWRLLGVRVGRMLLDDGASMPERSMVVLGDHVTLGARSTLHGHSLEDGVFKSGAIRLGDGVTVGPSALVHYGVAVGDEGRVAPDAFLMKGEVVRAGETWAGNPAHPAPAAP